MKSILLFLCLFAGVSNAQQSLTVTFNLTAEQWDTLTNKVAVVNSELADKYAADLVTWNAAVSAAHITNQPEPPRPVLVVLDPTSYIQRFAASQLSSTRQELRATRESRVLERMRSLSDPAKLQKIDDYIKTLQP